MNATRPTMLLLAASLTAALVAPGCAPGNAGRSANGANRSARTPGGGEVVVTEGLRIKAGRVLKEAGQLDAALEEFNRVLAVNPASVDAVLGVGSVEHARQQYTQARDTYTRAVRLDGSRFDARYYLGLMNQVLGDTGEAIANYKKALELNPDDANSHRDLATAYLQVGRPDLALPHAEIAVELAPSSQPAWCNLAAAYSLSARYEDALRCYRTATEIDDLEAPVLLGLGDTHLKLNNFQRAVNTLAELVRRFPGALAHERLGYALFRTYDFRNSTAQYRRSLAYNPEELGALNGLGACLITGYMQQENRRRKARLFEALDAWRLSLRIDPNQPQIVDLLTRYDLPD